MSASMSVECRERGVIGPRTIDLLASTRPWVCFLAILLLVTGGLNVLVAVFGLIAAPFSPLLGLGLTVMYGCWAVVCIVPALHLLGYASRITAYLQDPVGHALDEALRCQTSFWRLMGRLSIVVVCYFVMTVGLAVAGAIQAFPG
ncbi:MAG: hypothetical protein KDA21_03955 [Phycisphaerales bacterium]|nr:hypothetical protein [Phycisphaerales bacterium]